MSDAPLNNEELERYARHIILREIGGPGQRRLRRARLLVIGAGGLGCPALMYLAAAGVGAIRLVDDDIVSLSNLQRQILFGGDDLDQPKVAAATRRLNALNPGCAIEPIQTRFNKDTAADLADGVDLILDGSDNFATRRLANSAAIGAGVPLVFGAVGQWEGQVSLFAPAEGGPCYHCIFPEDPSADLAPSCAEAGIVGALTGVIGALMATEAIKRLSGAGEALSDRLVLYDALSAEFRTIRMKKRADCPACGSLARG
ncbi:MAG: molybdopterin-synthase adenylyltransferase MoeB [Neomegalonema sp.]|nr:molybdopterin-synthase adenylyltransferase MoeB [Neomegalonema sp.]